MKPDYKTGIKNVWRVILLCLTIITVISSCSTEAPGFDTTDELPSNQTTPPTDSRTDEITTPVKTYPEGLEASAQLFRDGSTAKGIEQLYSAQGQTQDNIELLFTELIEKNSDIGDDRRDILSEIIKSIDDARYSDLLNYAYNEYIAYNASSEFGETLYDTMVRLGRPEFVFSAMLSDEEFSSYYDSLVKRTVEYGDYSDYYNAIAAMLGCEYGAIIQRITGMRRNSVRDVMLNMLAALSAESADYAIECMAEYGNLSEEGKAMFESMMADVVLGVYDEDDAKTSLDRIFVYSMTPNDPAGTPSEFTGTSLTRTWSDEFDGDTLGDTWNYGQCGTQTVFGDIGDIDQYRADHIYVSEGDLVLKVEYMDNSVLNPGNPDYCGDQNVSNIWVDSKNNFTQTYGYFEMRCKLGNGSGSNCAFWMAAGDPWAYDSRSSVDGAEIDVFESIAGWVDRWGNNKKIESTVHWQHNTGGKSKTHTYFYNSKGWTRDDTKVPVDFFDEEYHTFGVLWTKEEYAFFYDGYEVYRTDCTENGGQGVCNQPAYILISNHFMDYDWYGQSTPDGYPYEFRIDYIRAYQLDEYLPAEN